jgi:hypothetical protein
MKVIPLLDEAQLAQINSFIQTLSFTDGQATAQEVSPSNSNKMNKF